MGDSRLRSVDRSLIDVGLEQGLEALDRQKPIAWLPIEVRVDYMTPGAIHAASRSHRHRGDHAVWLVLIDVGHTDSLGLDLEVRVAGDQRHGRGEGRPGQLDSKREDLIVGVIAIEPVGYLLPAPVPGSHGVQPQVSVDRLPGAPPIVSDLLT